MRLLAIVVLLALLLTACTNGGATPKPDSSSDKPAPRLSVAKPSYDFGAIPFGKGVEAVFNYQNVGNAPLVLTGKPEVRVVEGC